MLCHPEPFWKCCDTEPLCFSDTLVPKEPSGSQAENVSLCIQPTACQDSSVWRHLVGRVRGHLSFLFSLARSPSFSGFCIVLYNRREMLHLLQNYNSSLKKNSGWSLVMWMSSGKKSEQETSASVIETFFFFSWILHDSRAEAETARLNCELDE